MFFFFVLFLLYIHTVYTEFYGCIKQSEHTRFTLGEDKNDDKNKNDDDDDCE